MSEVARLLRVGGQALVCVWAVEQEKNNVKSKYLRSSKTDACANSPFTVLPVTSEIASLPVHINGTAFKAQDMLVPWHMRKNTAEEGGRKRNSEMADSRTAATNDESTALTETEILHRYYHTFVSGELERLCQQVAGIRLVNSYYDQGNWCVVIERVMNTEH